MVKFLFSKIFGKCIARCSAAYAEEFIRLIRQGGFTTDPVRFEGDHYTVTLPESRAERLRRMADHAGIDCTVESLPGLPALARRYRHRPGILAGALVFFAIVWLSGRIVWDFEITGNKNVSDTEIIAALESLGCSAGTFISDINIDMVQNDCLNISDRLAWISVNMDGNLARVEVREKRVVPVKSPPVKGQYANIVAAEDGVVELCHVIRGDAAVEQGDVVKKGELLISGVIDVGETGVRYDYADGEVMAKVYREIESFVPYERRIETPTGEEKSEICVKIFGKVTNLSLRGRIDYDLYGKIIEERKLSLPFGITLPVWVTETVYSEMREETVTLTEAEAAAAARDEVSSRLREMTDTLQVLSVSENCAAEDGGVRVTLGVYGVTDISANLGFSASDGMTEEKEDIPQNEKDGNS